MKEPKITPRIYKDTDLQKDMVDALKYWDKGYIQSIPVPRPPTELEQLSEKLNVVSNQVGQLHRDMHDLRNLMYAIRRVRPDAIEDALNYMDVKRAMDSATKTS